MLSCTMCLVPHVILCQTCMVPCVLSEPTCLVLYVFSFLRASCSTCSRASCTLCPSCSRALLVSYPTCSRTLRVLVPYVPRAFCRACFRASRSSYLGCSLSPPARVIRVLVPHVLCASRVSCLIWPRVSRFMSSFSLRTLSRTLCTLCPNFIVCVLEFPCLCSFSSCDFFGGIY